MKKLALSLAFIGFMAFVSNAQNAATNAVPAKKETSAKASAEPAATKSCCAKDKKECGPNSASKSCCKGKDAKACTHEAGETKTSSTEAKPAAAPKGAPATK